MTRPTQPPTPNASNVPDVPGSTVSALHALYHEGAQAEPSLTLDRRILDAARAELRTNGAAKRQAPWWKSWLPVTSALAIAIVGLSVTWRVMDEQERHLREEMRAAQAAGDRAGKGAPAQRSAEAQPSPGAPTPAMEKSRRAEAAVVRETPIGVAEPEARPTPAAIVAPAAPAATAPVPVEEALKRGQRAEINELRDRRDAGASMETAPGPARQSGKLEARRPGVGVSSETATDSLAASPANSAAKSAAGSGFASGAQSAVDAATPEAWLKQIRELRSARRGAEAAQSLARFRARYPDFALPDDLLDLK